jgi:hypothetical protein
MMLPAGHSASEDFKAAALAAAALSSGTRPVRILPTVSEEGSLMLLEGHSGSSEHARAINEPSANRTISTLSAIVLFFGVIALLSAGRALYAEQAGPCALVIQANREAISNISATSPPRYSMVEFSGYRTSGAQARFGLAALAALLAAVASVCGLVGSHFQSVKVLYVFTGLSWAAIVLGAASGLEMLHFGGTLYQSCGEFAARQKVAPRSSVGGSAVCVDRYNAYYQLKLADFQPLEADVFWCHDFSEALAPEEPAAVPSLPATPSPASRGHPGGRPRGALSPSPPSPRPLSPSSRPSEWLEEREAGLGCRCSCRRELVSLCGTLAPLATLAGLALWFLCNLLTLVVGIRFCCRLVDVRTQLAQAPRALEARRLSAAPSA